MAFTLHMPRALRASRAPFGSAASVRPRRASAPVRSTPEQMQQMMQDPAVAERMKQMMQDPAMAERMRQMQEAMQRPEMQQQMAQMQAYMQNQQLQQRMQELRSDPEFKEMFEEIATGGMPAMMKYMNDPRVLAKIGERLGDIQVDPTAAAAAGPAAAAGAAPAVPAGPEVNDLFDAAKYGDEEAVEDFIAIGKDVNGKDSQQRTPLHFASGFGHGNVAKMLLAEGAELEAADSMGNTPLHYAAGYGRPQLVELLLEAGASTSAKNSNGKTPAEVAGLNPNNPITQSEELMAKLAPQ